MQGGEGQSGYPPPPPPGGYYGQPPGGYGQPQSGYGYGQPQSGYGYGQPQGGYGQSPGGYVPPSPPQGFGGRAQVDPAKLTELAGKCAKCIAIADIVITLLLTSALIACGIVEFIEWALVGTLGAFYVGSIVASILIIVTQPKKKWAAIVWVVWNILRLLAEIIGPIVYTVIHIPNLNLENSGKSSTDSEGNEILAGIKLTVVIAVWCCWGFSAIIVYGVFLSYVGRYWRSFSISSKSIMNTGLYQPPASFNTEPPPYQYQSGSY